MSHAEICPVCYGEGKVQKPSNTWTTAVFEETCRGCGGKGWVTVEGWSGADFHDVDKFYAPDEEPTVARITEGEGEEMSDKRLSTADMIEMVDAQVDVDYRDAIVARLRAADAICAEWRAWRDNPTKGMAAISKAIAAYKEEGR